MNIHVQTLNAGGRLTKLRHTIEEASRLAIAHVTEYIPVDNVDIIFYDHPQRAIEHLGFGGYSLTDNLVMIPVNPKFRNLEIRLKEKFVRTLSHELYHCLRHYTYAKRHTLFESLMNEGLADHFDIEINKSEPEKWDTALDKTQIEEWTNRAKEEFNSYDYNHQAWFLGSKIRNIPHWTGYSIGFSIVGKYLQKHPDKKPSHLYNVEAKEFIE
ncbi:hypothetical protein A2Z00_01180 [Candidatus Gottesmanbacteria bacterium RBG_13_45_10]|uniref:DUF2268 domain-containing protein n=1 Tax=Candidatus Gottesmanbacteria bacterium RBG_13_45_10 TaxID=1798370 RepID=A0A1F5ZGM0_9BACT|nr:MAG: hypothetical protein A2Z00_01180 [Candidatus Gottesmanbacteria bacterium RBG_13_45_10]